MVMRNVRVAVMDITLKVCNVIENQCTCEHGVAANGTDCPTHGDEMRVFDSGYHVNDGICEAKQGSTKTTAMESCEAIKTGET